MVLYLALTAYNKVSAQEKALANTTIEVGELKKSSMESYKDIAVMKNDIVSIKDSQKTLQEDIKDFIKWARRTNNNGR